MLWLYGFTPCFDGALICGRLTHDHYPKALYLGPDSGITQYLFYLSTRCNTR